ncbi:High affinity immunoglobulin epsilon receptor subunit alpha [Heterocephalus glaber]|nr:High affinity immunoglobulin epsilon receptor subunit alpha [Heterocephalus glaber]
MAAAMDGAPLLWIALLLFSPRKSVISLSPPWNRIFEGENVTLTCNRNNLPEDNLTTWFHGGTNFSTRTSNLDIVNANLQDNGTYECQNQNLPRSDPMYLELFRDWLLLQTSAEVVVEGSSLSLRCHGWKNWTVYSPIYYKDGQPFKYCYENNVSITITNMAASDSGTYHCTGFFTLKQKKQNKTYVSESLNITVIKGQQSKYFWLQLIIPLLVVILLVVDMGLFVSTDKQFKSLLKMKTTKKGNKLQNPHPGADPQGN